MLGKHRVYNFLTVARVNQISIGAHLQKTEKMFEGNLILLMKTNFSTGWQHSYTGKPTKLQESV